MGPILVHITIPINLIFYTETNLNGNVYDGYTL